MILPASRAKTAISEKSSPPENPYDNGT